MYTKRERKYVDVSVSLKYLSSLFKLIFVSWLSLRKSAKFHLNGKINISCTAWWFKITINQHIKWKRQTRKEQRDSDAPPAEWSNGGALWQQTSLTSSGHTGELHNMFMKMFTFQLQEIHYILLCSVNNASLDLHSDDESNICVCI